MIMILKKKFFVCSNMARTSKTKYMDILVSTHMFISFVCVGSNREVFLNAPLIATTQKCLNHKGEFTMDGCNNVNYLKVDFLLYVFKCNGIRDLSFNF